MNSKDESLTQEVLDDAIKMLYASRPAKAAALLGLVNPEEPISLAPVLENLKMGMAMASQGIPLAGPGGAYASPAGISPKIPQDSLKKVTEEVKKTMGDDITKGPGQLGNNISESEGKDIAKGASLSKEAMTEEEYMLYQAGMMPMSEASSGPSLTPTQLAILGGGTVGIAGTNRMRAKNVAARELNKVRREYIDSIKDNALTRGQLRNLNKELKLRGALPSLTMAPTLGIADARMAKAEKNLTSKILKNRYRGALPRLAAGLVGTLAYNKLNEG